MRTIDEQRASITATSAAIAGAAAADPGTPVPDCPGWTLGDLACHLAAIQRWAAGIVRDRPDRRPDRDESGPTDASVADWLRAATAELDTALAAADLDAPCWTFGPSGTVGFWARRQAQEALVHHRDATVALGAPAVIAPPAAAEGVTEFFDTFVWKWGVAGGDWTGDGETCHLHATDTDGEWHLTLRPDGPPELTLGHVKGDVAVRGPAEHLLLAVWRRLPTDGLEFLGQDVAVDRWRSRLTSLRI